mmetsp:Transcript_106807/g.229950  ORF Transcript_106807/g.229950 Transcript_106807/m.229950 type:complete len:217 (-) Transcript_106807:163-813(-)
MRLSQGIFTALHATVVARHRFSALMKALYFSWKNCLLRVSQEWYGSAETVVWHLSASVSGFLWSARKASQAAFMAFLFDSTTFLQASFATYCVFSCLRQTLWLELLEPRTRFMALMGAVEAVLRPLHRVKPSLKALSFFLASSCPFEISGSISSLIIFLIVSANDSMPGVALPAALSWPRLTSVLSISSMLCGSVSVALASRERDPACSFCSRSAA